MTNATVTEALTRKQITQVTPRTSNRKLPVNILVIFMACQCKPGNAPIHYVFKQILRRRRDRFYVCFSDLIIWVHRRSNNQPLWALNDVRASPATTNRSKPSMTSARLTSNNQPLLQALNDVRASRHGSGYCDTDDYTITTPLSTPTAIIPCIFKCVGLYIARYSRTDIGQNRVAHSGVSRVLHPVLDQNS